MRSFNYATVIQVLLITVALFIIVCTQCPIKKVITYNTALIDMTLASGIPNNRLERRDAIIGELRTMKADVVCLQEVWIGHDVGHIVEGVADVYMYSTSKLHIGGKLPSKTSLKKPACDFMALTNFVWCATVHGCLKKKDRYQIFQCVAGSCYEPYRMLSQQCVSCVILSFSSQLMAVYGNCAANGTPLPGMRRINEPGLLLLSKMPMWNAKYTDFHPYTTELTERGYLETDVGGLGKVVCTHTTNNMPYYNEIDLWINAVFGTYIEQGNAERAHLINRFRHTSPIILMGDFNVGDAVLPFVIPDLPNEFFSLAKMFNVITLQQCTLCWGPDNPYNADSEALVNTVVDHVFYRGHNVQKVVRIFSPSDVVLFSSGLPLSDHNGVMAILNMC